uniref:DNA-directed RNA polymerase n=1 Tax=viral metagenome TaxID=1070528 RepID=A0A6C0I5Q0_9ZZZZ
MSAPAARHICNTYYIDTPHPIVQHHIDSFDDLLTRQIPLFIKASNPIKLLLPSEKRSIEIWVGRRDGSHIRYTPPLDELELAVMPNTCRTENRTYAIDVKADIEFVYTFETGAPEVMLFQDIMIAQIPLMLRSKFCHLSALNPDQMYEQGECRHELGGYFIIDGSERVLLSQERLGNNLFYSGSKIYKAVKGEDVVGGETRERGEDRSFFGAIRSASEDGIRKPSSHYLEIPPKPREVDLKEAEEKEITDLGATRLGVSGRIPVLTLPGFKESIPLISVFRAFGLSNDKDIYDTILAGIPDKDRSLYDDMFMQFVLSHDRRLDDDNINDLSILRRTTKTRSIEEVFYNLQVLAFPHIEQDEDTAAMYRKKAYCLGYMTRMAMESAAGITKPTDRDHFRFKRFDVSGDLIFQEFRVAYNDISKAMTLALDTRLHFEERLYSGRNITNLVQRENIGYYWKHYTFMNSLSKSFKGKWGGKDGVSQILSRVSMLGTISQLRRTNLDMDESSKILGARRLHGSSFGFTCPSDVPDGRSVGMVKHFALLTTVSTSSPRSEIASALRSFPHFRPLSTIHPSSWNPSWTRIRLNGDIMGVSTRDTIELYRMLIDMRRKAAISPSVSIAWNRTDNDMILATDQGRTMRPLYREGVTHDQVLSKKTWDTLRAYAFDFVDAEECDTVRISLAPFSATNPSEIHGIFMLSPLSSVIPFCDHNPSPRVCFSCAQCRQGASWFHSNFNKRFDTITLILNSPQRPICETWAYPHMLGRGGCMPYGENAIVAIATYSGYNQEDSVILNRNSLDRGMFRTTYFHSYSASEEMIDPNAKIHTQIANVALNPLYSETVKTKPDKDYSKLDENGFIKLGSHVDENTVLVGMVSPSVDATGVIKGHSDVSLTPKRGQTGIVDGIQVYNLKDGIIGVKVRVAESRGPILGDKFSSRAGQKGTVGMIMPDSDLPFNSKGLRPDLILNPHAIPSRMTTGQHLESMSARIGNTVGSLIDATPFTAQNQVTEYRELLLKHGFEPNGSDMMYNGMTGEMMEMEIFLGPVYYLRSKLMVEDKINYRDTGSRTLLTHQPLEGRSAGGGLRIGEMERDGLIAHGVSAFIQESFMKRSDEHEVLYQPSSGLLDTTQKGEIVTLKMPYAMSLFIKEVESMHVSTYIKTAEL